MFTRPWQHCLWVVSVAVLVWSSSALRADQSDFSGDWQTYWRTGSAVLSLAQDGNRVSGTYQPDDGVVEGVVEGDVLRGTWEEPGAAGRFVFVLSGNGDVLTGRFGNGEYWNGFRDDSERGSSTWQLANGTPRETLRSVLLAVNAAIHAGDSGALRAVDRLVTYAGPATSAGDRASRRALMFDILDMSTLRIMDAPDAPEETMVDFEVGPAGVTDKTTLSFEQDVFGQWRLLLPEANKLADERARLLSARGFESMAELNRARLDSPRTVLREFVQGTSNWDAGGRARALATLDLSHIPKRLHALEGPIYADILKRILDRVAYVIWQEIPDDPNRSVPYVYFQHPVGNVTIARIPGPVLDAAQDAANTGKSAAAWKFDSVTLASAPALLEVMQDLPPIPGLEQPQALSPYFHLRESMRSVAPRLLEKWGYLEAWQWLGLVSAVISAVAVLFLARRADRRLSGSGARSAAATKLGLPVGTVMAAVILFWATTRLGLTQIGLPFVGTLTGIALILAIAFLTYRLVSIIGGWFLSRAEQTSSYVDEIAASLGTGLSKLLIIVGAVIAIADVAGLPYEGVLAGLGVGGIALAFAARDTVSNMMGGGILMADRPFQRGDLIEHAGTLATVEHVGLRSTKLRALDDTLLHVPNSHLSDQKIANWGQRRRRKLTMQIGLTYDTPREKLADFVERLREVLRATPSVDNDEIYVGLRGFGASSIDIDMIYFFRVFSYTEQVEMQHQLMIAIIALADEVGVAFAFPTRTLYLSQTGASSTSNEATDRSRVRGPDPTLVPAKEMTASTT